MGLAVGWGCWLPQSKGGAALCCILLASKGVWFWGLHSWGLVGGGLELSLKLGEEFCSNGSAQLVDDVLGNLGGHGSVSGVHIG